jgi:transcriptional regulator with XRE-family HTH domain
MELTFTSPLNQTNKEIKEINKDDVLLPIRLRKLRESKNWTMDDVSKKIDVKRQTYNGYEAPREKSYHRSPSFEVLLRLSDLYNVSTDYLIGVTDNPAPHDSAVDVFSALESYDQMDEYTRQYIQAMLKKIVSDFGTDKAV